MRRSLEAFCGTAICAVLLSCGSDDSPSVQGQAGASGDAGVAGSGGASGSAGTSGSAGSAGAAGQGGAPGQGGGAGSAGAGGGPPSTDCSLANVLCVDDTAGTQQEYATIQQAADVAAPGDTVVVWDGAYAGFQADKSGALGAPVYYFAASDQVTITSPAGTGDAIRLQNVSHVVLDGFRIVAPPQRCVAARGATPESPMIGLTVRRIRCEQAGVEGFYLSEVSQSRIEANEVSGAGATGDTRSHCIYLANAGSDGTTLRGNVLHGCQAGESNGIHFNGDLSVGGDGIISGVVVEGNIIYDNGQNGLNMDGVQDALVQNNIIYGNARNALRAYAIDAAQGPKALRVINNTLIASVSGWAFKTSEDLSGHVLFNNVLFGAAGAISIESSQGVQSDYNIVTDQLSADGETSVLQLAGWQALGLDPHSVVSDQASLFQAPGTGDFHLKAGAVAIDKGIAQFASLSAPAVDAFGTLRPQGTAFDIGADEF